MHRSSRILGLFFATTRLVQVLAGNVSTRGPAVLQMETGVRALGMGGAYAAVADDASALYWNPAGLQQTKRQELQLMRAESFVGQTENVASYTRPSWQAGERNTWGLSVHQLTLPNFEVLDEGTTVGSARPQEFTVGLSHARPLFGLSCGMTLKWVKTEMFEQTGQTLAGDLGVLGQGWGNTAWGVALTNAGPSMKLGSDKMGLPLTVRAGLSKHFPIRVGEWVAAGDVDYTMEGSPSGRVGVEYAVPVGRDWRVALRSGARTNGEGRFSFGGGVEKGNLGLNYAFTSFGDLGSSSRMDFTLRFGGELAPEVRRRELLGKARDYTDNGELSKARGTVEELKTISPRSRDVKELDREVRIRFSESLEPENLLDLGKESLEARNYSDAVQRFQKLLLVDPSNKEGRILLTRAETMFENEKQARLKAEVARSRTQQRSQWEKEAQARFAQQDWLSSVNLWRKWMQAGGDSKRGDIEIRRCWEKIYTEADNSLAHGDPERALALFQSIGPGYMNAGEKAKRIASDLQQKHIAIGKEKYERGMEAYVAGDLKKAEALFQEALSHNPSDQRASQALSRIREELRPGKSP